MSDKRFANLINDLRSTILGLCGEVRTHLGTADPGPDTDDPIKLARYWIWRYYESLGYTRYPANKAGRTPMAKLGERGWERRWRAPSMVDPNRRPPMPDEDPLARDPVARVVRGADVDETLVKTPSGLLEEAERARRADPDLEAPPAGPEELHGHLVKIAPALQSRVLYQDERSVRYFIEAFGLIPRDPRKYSRYGYARTEYWENTRTGNGLWVFVVSRSGRRKPERWIVRNVWDRIKVIERVAEHDGEPFMHGLLEGEDERMRNTVEDLVMDASHMGALRRADAED